MAISDCEDKTPIATSPASSGPAGAHFEGQVGAFYLLSMLTGAEPRGLPGTMFDRVELQRAAEGHPLDDVIVHAHNALGSPAVLEIQVKRSITFTPKDPIFRAVVDQIARASQKAEFRVSCYELAIATERTSGKIGAYQDVLTWARHLGDATTFTARINRPGSANDDMRTFVHTFKTHLHNGGVPDDDETVWFLLSRLQILMFDFTFPGSVSETLVKERAAHALHPDDTLRASAFWGALVDLTLQVAASGGDRTRDRLIEDMTSRSFRLAGAQRYTTVRAALAEYSKNAISDISDHIGGVLLTRHEHIGAIHAALDDGRYVEIRGDAGVGKSGVLKHFAQQVAIESQVIVFSPSRTITKGWTAMRAVLGFDGTARDLLVDIAAGGGATLFIDNLDLFNDEERRTVVDIIREAAGVPGFSVIVTARRNFGIEEPNWLPAEILDRLGRAEPVMINELTDAEVGEIKHAAPALSSLLADNHPARKVARNLFRLSRLANLQGDEPTPRTEVDMAEQWWHSADGRRDADHRERARLLKVLAEQALLSAGPYDVSNFPPKAINSLIASETLRDQGNDRVAFQHDVLREWAIANLLYIDRTMIERLPLGGSAAASFERGVELAARMTLERSADATQWQTLMTHLTSDGIHGAWRRAALLALVRSEIAPELLSRASTFLIADRACLLCELIRTVMAVDVVPASKLFGAAAVDQAPMLASLNVPGGPSWHRLIEWLLNLGQSLPVAAIPDVVDLYAAWSRGLMLLHDQLTPLLLRWQHHWLTEIETARDADSFHKLREPFGGEIDRDRIGSLESELRTNFLLFCNRTPDLAVDYLQSLGRRRRNSEAVRSILKFRGTLAQAAPAELAELVATALIPKPQPDNRHHRHKRDELDELDEPFDYIDHQFLPVSPSQGPFYELLTHAAEHGLLLIHRLIDHAISFFTGGSDYGDDAMTISFPDGMRPFPWFRTYAWSREYVAAPACVTSALMALEAWAHARIEAGEAFDKVLADVLGPPGTPAAYLLVAVDLLISHWPQTRQAAVPFLGCPELLSIDLSRQSNDKIEIPDYFGLKAMQKEPAGSVSLEALKKRPSRRHTLNELLGEYAVFGPAELRETLICLISFESARLGLPDKEADLGDPAFMVVHALNRLNPKNWREVSVTQRDGTELTAFEYVPPEAETIHLTPLQEAANESQADFRMQLILGRVLEDPSQSSPELAKAAVEWAKNVTAVSKQRTDDEESRYIEAIITAAMIAIRDGDADLCAQNEAWARTVFAQAMQTKEDPVHRSRSGLRFNPVAIALVGVIQLLKQHNDTRDVRTLLEEVARENPATAHGFCAAVTTLAAIDERLPRSVLRCAFTACIKPGSKWDLSEKEIAARSKRYQKRVQAAVNAELTWLANDGPEPGWPTFIAEAVRLRNGLRVPGGQVQQATPASTRSQPNERVDCHAAALWLQGSRGVFDVVKRPWLRDIARAYCSWTAASNGAGLDAYEEIDYPPREWNGAFFDLLAHCLPGLAPAEIDELVLAPIISLPDRPFFDVISKFLQSVDAVYFNNGGMHENIAVSVRTALAQRLMSSRGWQRLGGTRSATIEMHLGPAVATMLFNNYLINQPPKCYLLPLGADRLDPFLPVLKMLAESGPSHFVAVMTLNLVEVVPKSSNLPFIVSAATAWLKSYPDDTYFWIDHDIGRRVCALVEGVWREEPALLDSKQMVRFDVDRLLAALISLGAMEARRLEESLR